MKRIIPVVLAILLILGSLAGCGSSAPKEASNSASWSGYDYKAENDAAPASAADHAAEMPDEIDSPASSIAGNGFIYQQNTDLASKIIYSAYLSIETTAFDDSINDLYAMLGENGAFLESSSTGGVSYSDTYYGRQSYRTAEFTIRVPKENFSAMITGMSQLGNILRNNVYSENITEQYTDTESRLSTYRIEEERLLAMLEKAETVEDMLTIESRLSEVRYHIESLTSSLRNWDNLVNYSTVTVYLSEVKELTEQLGPQRTYWQEIGDGLRVTVKNVARFFKNLFRDIVVALPVLLIIAVLVVIIVLIIRSATKKRRRGEGRISRRAARKQRHSSGGFDPSGGGGEEN